MVVSIWYAVIIYSVHYDFLKTVKCKNCGPKANEVQFSFITTAGVRVYECNLSELQNGHPFYNIFKMFTEIKSAADKLSKLLPLADVVNKIKK